MIVLVALVPELEALKDEQHRLLLVVHYELLADQDGEKILTLGQAHAEDLVFFPCLRFCKVYWDLAHLFKTIQVKQKYLGSIIHDKNIHRGHLYCLGPLKIAIINLHTQIMHVLAIVQFKARLVPLVRDAVLYVRRCHRPVAVLLELVWSDYHLVAVHVVVDHVLQDRLVCLLFD